MKPRNIPIIASKKLLANQDYAIDRRAGQDHEFIKRRAEVTKTLNAHPDIITAYSSQKNRLLAIFDKHERRVIYAQLIKRISPQTKIDRRKTERQLRTILEELIKKH